MPISTHGRLVAVLTLIVAGQSTVVPAQESLFDRRSRRPWWSTLQDEEIDEDRRSGFELDLPLAERRLPVDVDASLIFDGSRVLNGGQKTHRAAFRNLFELALSAPTELLFGLEGGTVQVMFQNHAGTNGSGLIGDQQGFSNIDADGRTQVSALWYEQVLDDDQWRFRLGKMDANSQFAFVEHGLPFLNSSMGYSPTIFVMPTYPDPSFGASLFFEPEAGLYAGFGLFDGAGARGIPTGSRGFGSLLSGTDLFLIGELGWKWSIFGEPIADEPAYPGRIGIGGWFHDGTFDRFDGNSQNGAGGLYVVFGQQLLREFDDETGTQGLGMFAQYGYANPEVSAMTQHFGTGVAWTGLIPGRDADLLGIGISIVQLSDRPGSGFTARYETATELFYQAQLSHQASLVFDLQHIANPGGQGTKDALVGTMRFVLAGSLFDLLSDADIDF